MNINPESSAQMDFDTAQREAQVMSESIRHYNEPVMKNSLLNGGSDTGKLLAEKFGDTAYIEFSEQELAQMEQKHPHIYDGLMQRQKHFNSLTESLYPDYVRMDRTHHMQPSQLANAVNQASDAEKAQAYIDARELALSLMNKLAREIDEREPRDPKAEFKLALDLALNQSASYGIDTEDIGKVNSLASAALATFRVNRMTKRGTPGWDADINRAIDKHNLYAKRVRTIAS